MIFGIVQMILKIQKKDGREKKLASHQPPPAYERSLKKKHGMPHFTRITSKQCISCDYCHSHPSAGKVTGSLWSSALFVAWALQPTGTACQNSGAQGPAVWPWQEVGGCKCSAGGELQGPGILGKACFHLCTARWAAPGTPTLAFWCITPIPGIMERRSGAKGRLFITHLWWSDFEKSGASCNIAGLLGRRIELSNWGKGR